MRPADSTPTRTRQSPNTCHSWLATKALVLKPTTMARHRDYVHNDLAPAFGTLKLDELGHRHIATFVTGELDAGRGTTTLYRCLATLSSAPGDAVRQHRLAHNPASPPALHRPPPPERRIRTAGEAVRFLQRCHRADPEMADLFEFLIGTGLRKGEALALHWDDVHLAERVLYVRCTLSAIDNNHLVITTPKTRTSRTGSPSHPASPPPSNTGPDQGLTPTAAQATRSPDSSSADPTASRCGPTPSSTGSGSCPKKPACHG